ncbi:MAG: G5 domain-containing protein [Defluviitaleaceae bacterium]|nr:G5 domain-containing protein [Defluviitaleaceae bacterium]
MSKDNDGFFAARPSTAETLRQYKPYKRRNKPGAKPPDNSRPKDMPKSAKKTPSRRSSRRRARWLVRGFGLAALALLAVLARYPRIAAATVAAAALAIAAGTWLLVSYNSLEVFIDGEPAGFIAERDTTPEDITAQLETAISVTAGTNVRLNETITLEAARAPSDAQVLARHEIMPILRLAVTFAAEGFVIYIDGEARGILRNSEAAESVLDGIVQHSIPDGTQLIGQPDFTEDVSIRTRFMDEDNFESVEAVIARLSQQRPVSQGYVVQSGDSMSIIAQRVGMSLEDILAANPGVDPGSLSIGQTLDVVRMVPTLSVRTVELSVTNEDEPYQTEVISNPMQVSTYRSVIQPGRAGVREVTRHVTRVNGVITNTEVIGEQVLQEPLNETVVVGTRGS